jgi:hypothetical protein
MKTAKLLAILAPALGLVVWFAGVSEAAPMGAWAPLYAESVSRAEVVVRVAEGGAEDVSFSYYITAARESFEEHQPIRKNQHFTADGMGVSQFESRYAENTVDNKAIRAMLQSSGILTADGKLNMDTVTVLGWNVKASDAEHVEPATPWRVYAREQTANRLAAD